MSIQLFLLAALPASILFLFRYWRRLKEDYLPVHIFSSGFYLLFGIIGGAFIGHYLSDYFAPTPIFDPSGLWFWFAVIGFSLAVFLTYKRFRMRPFEMFNSAVAGMIALIWTISIIVFIYSRGREAIAELIITTATAFVFAYIDKHYKRFSWYKSGKVGFAGLVAFGMLFVIRGVVAVVEPGMLSFVGRVDIVLSSLAAFLLFFSVYNLSSS